MKHKILIFLVFALFANPIFSQTVILDVVYLNNGSVIKGTIVEYFIDDHVTIKTTEGKIYTFKAPEIKTVNADVSQYFKQPSNGYFNNTSFGVLIGEANFNNPIVNFTFSTVNGYRFNEHLQAGVGLGMDVIYQNIIFPVFADAKLYLRKSSFSPFIGFFAGYALQEKEKEEPEEYYYYNNLKSLESGHMYGFELGIRNYTKENVGFTLSAGYRFQYLSTIYTEWGYNVDVLEEYYLNRFKLTLGVIFN